MKRIEEVTYAVPVALSSVEVMAAALNITPTERFVLADLIRRRKLPMSRDGHLPVDVICSLVREIRGK